MKTRILSVITLLCAAIASLQIVQAGIITVMNTNDSGAGSLRQALADANDNDTITFDPGLNGLTITLTTGQLSVNDRVFIFGPGADMLAVSGNHTGRVFQIASGKTAVISGLTITNGTMNGNGGGIYNDHANLGLFDCMVSGNSAVDAHGGGIYNDHASLIVFYSTFSGNSARAGGGIYNDHATLTVNTCTVSGNSADSGFGGGILNSFATGGSATSQLGSTIFNASSIDNDAGTITSLGYNLSSDAAGGDGPPNTGPGGFLNAIGDIRNTDPKLDLLQNNGGLFRPTFTHALLPD